MIVLVIESNAETSDRLERSLKQDKRYTVVLSASSNAIGLDLLQKRSDIMRVCINSVIHGRGDAIEQLTKKNPVVRTGTR